MSPDILSTVTGTAQNLTYFSAFKNITEFVQTTGNGNYTLSDLDLNSLIPNYNQRGTHFGGWAILVVYENPILTLNQINIYQGLEALSPNFPTVASKTFNLNNLYLISNTGAKLGFIAWEGDRGIQQSEQLQFTANSVTNILSNSFNPSNNAFNGTNTETGSIVLYNMDLDIYSIEDYIVAGTTSASVTLQSAQDYVMLNTVVTKLNSQLPDATIVIDDYTTTCDSGSINLNYAVYNVNSTEILPANVRISFYIGTTLVGSAMTQNAIAIGGNETGSITITLPTGSPETVEIKAVVDNNLAITEINESNNSFVLEVSQRFTPEFNILEDLISCNKGFTKGIFDFSSYEELVKTNENHVVSFHTSLDDATNGINPINNTSNYEAIVTPTEIFVRIEIDDCFATTSFNLLTKNCPPTVYNAVSANNDTKNDAFFIEGLRDIFVNFKLEIYNRWGKLLWTGNQSKPDWDGFVAEGIGNEKAPAGTYYYILYLNDADFPEPLTGYLFLKY